MNHPKVWRPPVFATPDDLQNKVDEYFSVGYRTKTVYDSKTWQDIKIPKITMTDLAIYLGYASRQSMYDVEKNPLFSYIIKRARLFIEREYEERLSWNSPTGAIFALKNMWWRDKVETGVTDTDGKDVDNNITIKILDGNKSD